MLVILLVNMHGLLFWRIKKGTTITNTSQKVLKKSGWNPKTINMCRQR